MVCLGGVPGAGLGSGERRAGTRALEGTALLAEARGHPYESIQLYAAAGAIRDTIGSPISPAERDRHDPAMRRLRDALGEAEYQTTWDVGRTSGFEDTVETALSWLSGVQPVDA